MKRMRKLQGNDLLVHEDPVSTLGASFCGSKNFVFMYFPFRETVKHIVLHLRVVWCRIILSSLCGRAEDCEADS